MKPIKFKAWDREKKQWINPAQFAVPAMEADTGQILLYDGESDCWVGKTRQIEYVAFTGKIDKNGVELYGGHVVRFHYATGQEAIGVIRWNDDGYWQKYHKFPTGGASGSIGIENAEHWEVIGNIYENPELLER